MKKAMMVATLMVAAIGGVAQAEPIYEVSGTTTYQATMNGNLETFTLGVSGTFTPGTAASYDITIAASGGSTVFEFTNGDSSVSISGNTYTFGSNSGNFFGPYDVLIVTLDTALGAGPSPIDTSSHFNNNGDYYTAYFSPGGTFTPMASVPEPGSLVNIALAGATGLVGVAYRRRRKRSA